MAGIQASWCAGFPCTGRVQTRRTWGSLWDRGCSDSKLMCICQSLWLSGAPSVRSLERRYVIRDGHGNCSGRQAPISIGIAAVASDESWQDFGVRSLPMFSSTSPASATMNLLLLGESAVWVHEFLQCLGYEAGQHSLGNPEVPEVPKEGRIPAEAVVAGRKAIEPAPALLQAAAGVHEQSVQVACVS